MRVSYINPVLKKMFSESKLIIAKTVETKVTETAVKTETKPIIQETKPAPKPASTTPKVTKQELDDLKKDIEGMEFDELGGLSS